MILGTKTTTKNTKINKSTCKKFIQIILDGQEFHLTMNDWSKALGQAGTYTVRVTSDLEDDGA